MGIEPTLSAWEAEVLPLNYTRMTKSLSWGLNDMNTKPPLRTIRSFARRGRRLTIRQQQAVNEHRNEFCLSRQEIIYDLNKIFKRNAPRVLEIGFGMGQSLVIQAKQHPEWDFIGIEVHRPGIGALLTDIVTHQLTNIRIIEGDAVPIIKNGFHDASFAAVQLFFPDPWPKRRHHKRRIVQPEFAALIHGKLIPQGKFHLATDWEDYASHMLQVLGNHNGFINVAGVGHFSSRPLERPLTKFELRGQRLGHGVWDLLFEKVIA